MLRPAVHPIPCPCSRLLTCDLPTPSRCCSRKQVLADFHISRSNYQAAAGAMLAYARRLVAECPDEPAQLAEAERALATAVSCLRWVCGDSHAMVALLARSGCAVGHQWCGEKGSKQRTEQAWPTP